MPDLNDRNVEAAFRTSRNQKWGFAKYVRQGSRIHWDSADKQHRSIALQEGMTNPEDVGRIAGFVTDGQRILAIYSRSADFQAPSIIEQRNRTIEMWRELAEPQGIRVIPSLITNISETATTELPNLDW